MIKFDRILINLEGYKNQRIKISQPKKAITNRMKIKNNKINNQLKKQTNNKINKRVVKERKMNNSKIKISLKRNK